MTEVEVIIVGAGLAGLSAAQVLRQAGRTVLIVEKSRGVGGRTATRRVPTPQGEVLVDHGAQYFTARSPQFQTFLAPLRASGQVTVWLEHIPTLTPQGIVAAPASYHYPRYCCPQGMTSLAKTLALGVNINLDQKVTALERTKTWQVITETGAQFQAPALLMTAPLPQSLALLGKEGADFPTIDFDPCLAVMAGYREIPTLPKGLRWEGDPIIAWSAIDSSKRLSPTQPVLVFHSTPEFARAHDHIPRAEAMALVLAQANLRLGLPIPQWSQAHYWRYAQPAASLEKSYGYPEAQLVLAGDWCHGGRVEGAYLAGYQAAQALLN